MSNHSTMKSTQAALDALADVKGYLSHSDVDGATASVEKAEGVISKAVDDIENLKSGVMRSQLRQVLMQDLGLSRDELKEMARQSVNEIVGKQVAGMVADQKTLELIVTAQLQLMYQKTGSYNSSGDLRKLIETTVLNASNAYLRENFRLVVQNIGAAIPQIANKG